MDPASAPSDLHVVQPGGSELLFLEAGLAEDRVSVGVDEARSQQAALAIDADGVGISLLELRLRSDLGDPLSIDRYGDAGHKAGVIHLTSTSGSRRSAAGDDLGCVDEQQPG